SGVIFDAILNRAPVSPVRINPNLPAKLEDIINGALEKDRNLRYQHASDMRAELQRLKRDTDSGRAISQGVPEAMIPAAPASATSHDVLAQRVSRTSQDTISNLGVAPPPAPSSAVMVSKSSRLLLLVAVGAILALLAAGAVYWRSIKAHALTEKDTIVLADFSNTTGDAIFDDTLKQALATQLAQSPFLNILSDQRVSETLRMMGRSPGERITLEAAREICQRTGSTADASL